MKQIGQKCENFSCDAPYEDICCGECYKCALKGCRVCKYLDQCVAEHSWNEGAPKRIIERLEGRMDYHVEQYGQTFSSEDRGACDAYDDAIKIIKEELN